MDYIAQIVLFEGSRLSDWQLLFEDRCVNFVATLFFIAAFIYGVLLSPRSGKLPMCTLEVMNARVSSSATG